MSELVETWSAARDRKIAERADLEQEKADAGKKVNALAVRKKELIQAIKVGLNRRREDVGEYRVELEAVTVDLADARERFAGIEADLELIFTDPVDGLPALLERHRPELQENARQASAREAELVRSLLDVWREVQAARTSSIRQWREAWGMGPGVPGHRADELGDARVPGGSVFDCVLWEEYRHRARRGPSNATAGTVWLNPYETLETILAQLAGRDCLPGVAVTSTSAGSEGVYRRVLDGQRFTLDERELRHKRNEVVGEDGFSVYKFERALTEDDRQTLEGYRGDQQRWNEGLPSPNPVRSDGDYTKSTASESDPLPGSIPESERLREIPDDWPDTSDWVTYPDGSSGPPD
jgi:hypothetical protein